MSARASAKRLRSFADLGQDAGPGQFCQAGETGDDGGVEVLAERFGCGRSEIVGGLARGGELEQQRLGLPAECAFDQRKLVQVFLAQDSPQFFGAGVEAALAASATQRHVDLGLAELGGGRRCRGGVQDGAGTGLGMRQTDVLGLKRGQCGGEVLAQQAAELVGQLLAAPDGVLLSAGQYRDGLDEFGVVGQRPVVSSIDTQDVGQRHGVGVVAPGACDSVAFAIAGDGQRVDGVDHGAGRAQAGHQQPAAGLDRDRDQLALSIAMFSE